MNSSMFWLWATILMTALMWVPYIVHIIMTKGPEKAMMEVEPEDPKTFAPWARRAKAAHYNAVENLVLFAPLVIMGYVLKVNTPTFVSAVKIYFWARLAHYGVYTYGIPYARTITFAIAWGATMVMLCQIFKVV